MNDELKGFGRKQSWPSQSTTLVFSSRDFGKPQKYLSQDSWCPSRNSNREPPKYELRVPPLCQPLCLTSVGSKVLTAVTMKSTIFCCVTRVYSGVSSQVFQRNVLPPSSGSKNKPSKQQARNKQQKSQLVSCLA
jgi:hypothetical protein